MGTAASAFLNPIAAELEGVGPKPTANVLSRRGVMFLCTLFVVFNFSSRRSTPRQTAVVWTAMALGLAGLFLLTDKPISMPHGTYVERFATMTVFVLTIGRCMFLGIFSSSMRRSLYKSGGELKEAYTRIEELAELDELTGSFNRRCILRMLDDEIARARRGNTPCAIALIDLDWFKRINDAYGHPTGDEETPDTFLARADRALYAATAQGGNRIASA